MTIELVRAGLNWNKSWASIRSWSRVSVMLRISIASSSSALARHRAGVSEVEQRGSIDDLGHDARADELGVAGSRAQH